MCKQESYSKYQKSAIKFLTEHLGTDTPFSYEKTQSNHLKVLIEGIEKPIFTSSTPSDCKSLKNFIADVKRDLKASKKSSIPNNNMMLKSAFSNSMISCHEKLLQRCIKSLRLRLNIMKSQEQDTVLSELSLCVIQGNRQDIVKQAIARALQERKQGAYIKPKEMKKIEKKLRQHLDFMMPTLADYSALLDNKSRYQATPVAPVAANVIKQEVVDLKPSATPPSTKPATTKPAAVDANYSGCDNSAVQLMNMSANNRVSLLRDLSKAQALQLIDDINQAQALNLEQDIAAVVALIKEKNIPLEAIISRVEMA